jgi:hypothetical protein
MSFSFRVLLASLVFAFVVAIASSVSAQECRSGNCYSRIVRFPAVVRPFALREANLVVKTKVVYRPLRAVRLATRKSFRLCCRSRCK